MQMTFADSTKPTKFEKLTAHRNLGKTCVGFAVPTLIFCVDSLLNSIPSDADVFLHYLYYFLEVAAVVLLLVAGTIYSKPRGKDQEAKVLKEPHAAAEQAADSATATAHEQSRAPQEPMKQDDGLVLFNILPSTEVSVDDVIDQTFMQGKPLETSKPTKTDLHCCAEQESEVDLQCLMDAAQSAMETELEKQFEATLRRMDVECQSAIDAASTRMFELEDVVGEANAALQCCVSHADEANEAFPDTIEETEDPLEARLAELQNRIDEATRRRSNFKLQCGTVCVVLALVIAGSIIDCVHIEPCIMEACVLPVSMVCGYFFFSARGR